MLRTTVRLNSTLLNQAKKLAMERHTSLTAIMAEGLRHVLSLSRANKSSYKLVKLKVFKGTGLRPGVHLDSRSELLDRMDGLA